MANQKYPVSFSSVLVQAEQLQQLQEEADRLTANIQNLRKMSTDDTINFEAAILDAIKHMEENKRQLIYQIHPYKISPRNDTYGKTKKKRGGWLTRVNDNGKIRKMCAQTKEELEEKLLVFYHIVSTDSDISPESLAGLYDDWIRFRIESRNVSMNTIVRDQAIWNKYYKAQPITKVSLNKLKASAISSWFNELNNRASMTSKVYDQIRGVWRGIVKFGMMEERITKETIKYVPRPRKDSFDKGRIHTKENATILPEEREGFLNTLSELYEKSHFNTSYLGLKIDMYCGMRVGELCCLKWTDLDLEARVITLGREEVPHYEIIDGKPRQRGFDVVDHLKAGHDHRCIPLPKEASDILELIRSENERQGIQSEWVFVQKNGKRIHGTSFLKAMRKTLRKLGLEDKIAGVHTLRRTYVTLMMEAQIPEKKVQQWVGHRDIQTTKRYYDMPSDRPIPADADAVSRAMWGI